MNQTSPKHAFELTFALATCLLLATSVGCTRPKIIEPKPASPIIKEHMLNVQRATIALARAIDDGDSSGIDDTAGMIIDQYLRTRAIPLGDREDGKTIDIRRYDQELMAAVQEVRDLRGGVQSNRWELVSSSYGRMSASCIDCHNRYVERPIKVSLPSIRNF